MTDRGRAGTGGAAAMTLEQRLDIDRVRALWATAPASSAIGAVAGALWVVVFVGQEGLATMLVLFAIVVANQAVRVALWRRYSREPDDPSRTALWARRYTWTMVSGGLIWGIAAVLLFRADDSARQVFILVAVFGNTSGATAPNAYHPPAMILFIVSTLAPVMARVFMEGNLAYNIVGVALLMQIVLMILFGLNMYRELLASLRIRHDNAQMIEELRLRTEQAQEAQREAEQASRAKSQFFAAASHDLRQPLHALGLFAASLRDSVRTPENAQRVDQVLASVDALDELFDELLNISQLDAGQVVPAPVHVPAQRIFERLARIYGPVAAHENLQLAFRPTRAVLCTDPVLIERILGNLIGNALRYTARGGVLVGCRRRRGGWSLEVWDTGAGIDAADHERVFEEFVQLGNPERDRKKGLGLGLATVKRIAVLLDTPVTLASRPGRGSVFRVQVPAGDAARVAEESARPVEAQADALAGSVVVVIDDEKSVRDGMRDILGQWQCRVVEAGSAAEALAALEAAALQPSIAVVDYRLREGETGLTAVAALRARFGPQLPAMLVSGDAGAELFQLAREAGLLLLTKPVRAARLRAAIAHYLRRNAA